MKVNGEAIYGTTASPFKQAPLGPLHEESHDGGTTLYLHVFDWPADGNLVPGLKNEVAKAYLLSDRSQTALTVEKGSGEVIVKVPSDRTR